MSELSSEDIKKFLTTDEQIQRIVADRLGISDGYLEIEDLDPEERSYIEQTKKDAKDPKKWKRMTKYKVGSKTDRESFLSLWDLGPELTGGVDLNGGIARTFQLGDESIGVLTVEKDGKIVFIEDVGD